MPGPEDMSFKDNKELIKDIYDRIIVILKKYCDLDEKNYNLVALWIIGTYLHDEFPTFPYLFFNAMKGSGKTRLLKLVSVLCKNGELMASMSESVLFRTAATSTILIDEFEHIASKDKSALRELLNAAYKKGMSVKRIKKVKNLSGEGYEVEKFKVYCPIAMANIWGMENVLEDRCITLIIEKSSNRDITRLIEIFDIDPDILKLNELFSVMSAVYRCDSNIYIAWNNYITTIRHHDIHYTNDTNDTNFFDKIRDTSLDGRHLELFFPLFMIARECDVLDKTIETAEKISKSKKGDDMVENKDVSLIEFISRQEESKEFILEKDLLKKFKAFLEEEDEDAKWTNSRWFGLALKRLNLIVQKRRINKGKEVILNYLKAKEKIKMFREADKQEELPIIEEKVAVAPLKEVLPIKQDEDDLDEEGDDLEDA